MRKTFGSATEALRHLNSYLAGQETFGDLCGFARGIIRAYDDHYGDDDEVDHSDDLLWFFCAVTANFCDKLNHSHATEDEARSDLQGWASHLEKGDEEWRSIVVSGGWPLQFEDT